MTNPISKHKIDLKSASNDKKTYAENTVRNIFNKVLFSYLQIKSKYFFDEYFHTGTDKKMRYD